MQSGSSLRVTFFSNADITLMRRDILILRAQWILTIRNTARLSRSFQDVRTVMAEDIIQISLVDAPDAISVRDCFVQTVVVSAVAATLSLVAKRDIYENR